LVKVEKRNGENEAQMFHRFRKRVLRSQTLSIVRKKRWFVSKGEQHRMDEKKGIRRMLKKQQKREYRQ